MRPDPKILVAAEVATDGELVGNLLRDEFDSILIATDRERDVEVFESFRPDIVVLAFTALEGAESCYLGLYRRSGLIHTHPHRTIILCSKEDVRRVYLLCKRDYFDDYVLFWPIGHDAPRLLMAVHQAMRRLARDRSDSPSAAAFAAQARRLASLQEELDRYVASGQRLAERAQRDLQKVAASADGAVSGFSQRLMGGALEGFVEVRDQARLRRELESLRSAAAVDVTGATAPLTEWVGDLRRHVSSQAESVAELAGLAERVRPSVLVVDDDAVQHALIAHYLDQLNLDIAFSATAAGAMRHLQGARPDLVLMDVELPDIDGIELTRRIHALEPFAQLPVIMITGSSQRDRVLRSLEVGAVGFVVKPLDQRVLTGKVRAALGSR